MLNEQIKYIENKKKKKIVDDKKIIIKWVVCVTFGFFIQTLFVFFFLINFLSPSLSEENLLKWDKHIENFSERKSLKLQENIKSIRKIAVMVDWNAKNTVEKWKWINLGELHTLGITYVVLQKKS